MGESFFLNAFQCVSGHRRGTGRIENGKGVLPLKRVGCWGGSSLINTPGSAVHMCGMSVLLLTVLSSACATGGGSVVHTPLHLEPHS